MLTMEIRLADIDKPFAYRVLTRIVQKQKLDGKAKDGPNPLHMKKSIFIK